MDGAVAIDGTIAVDVGKIQSGSCDILLFVVKRKRWTVNDGSHREISMKAKAVDVKD